MDLPTKVHFTVNTDTYSCTALFAFCIDDMIEEKCADLAFDSRLSEEVDKLRRILNAGYYSKNIAEYALNPSNFFL